MHHERQPRTTRHDGNAPHGRGDIWRFAALCILAGTVAASDLVEVVTITDRIVALRFRDGQVNRHGQGQRLDADTTTSAPLATAALATAAFNITSAQHAAYATAQHPGAVNRKSKGDAFAFTSQNWDPAGTMGGGFYPTTPTWVQEHWVYLTLPTAVQATASYTIAWNRTTLNTNVASVTIAAGTAARRSEAVHVNTIGYLPDAPQKYGYLYHWGGSLGGVDYAAWAGQPFRLVRTSDGGTAFTGAVAFRAAANNAETAYDNISPNANFLGAAVWECNFSAFSQAGEYRLVVDGIGASYPFRIGTDVYLAPFRAVMKGLAQNRSGIALDTSWADEARPAPHNPTVTPGFANRLFYTTFRGCDMENGDSGSAADKTAIEAGRRGNLTATWGWYQDAGDWDGYITHTKIPLALLVMYANAPDRFSDGQLSLPESSNGIPDILDEAAWLPRFQHRLRHELMDRGWGTGGVGSRVFGDLWGPDLFNDLNTGSWGDTHRDWYVTGEDPFATFRYVAAAAMLAEALSGLGASDPQGVDWRTEAQQAYAWALANIRTGDAAKDYDGPLPQQRALAAAALYRLTGTASYHQQFLTDTTGISGELSETGLYAAAIYLTMPTGRAVDATRAATLRSLVLNDSINALRIGANNRAMRWAGNWWFPAGIGQATTPLIQSILVGETITRTSDATAFTDLRTMHTNTADYFLGANPLHSTWITGVGPRPPTGIFHMDDWAGGSTPRTGLIPYGSSRLGSPWFWWPMHIPQNQTWQYDTTYPSILVGSTSSNWLGDGIGSWPLHEVWFNLATAPQVGEFTIHQNHLNAAWTYGSLLPAASIPPTNQAPTISMPAHGPASIVLP